MSSFPILKTHYWPFAMLSQNLVFMIVIVCTGLIANLQLRYGNLWSAGQVWTALDSDPLMNNPYLQGPYADVVTGFVAFAGVLLVIVLISVLLNLIVHPSTRPSAMSYQYVMTMLCILFALASATMCLWEMASFGTDMVSISLLTPVPVLPVDPLAPATTSVRQPTSQSQIEGSLGTAVTGLTLTAGCLAVVNLILASNDWPTFVYETKSRRKRADGFELDESEVPIQ